MNDIIDLLNKRKKLFYDMLEYTKSKVFKNSEDDVERFEPYLDKRQKMFDEIKALDFKINVIKKELAASSVQHNRDVEKVEAETKDIIRLIIAEDKKNKAIMTELMEHIRQNLKNTKDIQKVNDGYNSVYSAFDNVGSYFDSRS